jgi:NAD+ synthase (glutamine-hydrolysing)
VIRVSGAPADPEDLAGQNLQARLRGHFLMGVANSRRLLVLNCTNRSEAMTGYGTLYGDLAGGLSPLGDVWKTDVWALARHANGVLGTGTIPQSVIDRVPSAELRAGQEDRQSLPDYPELDAILADWLERGMDEEALFAAGHRPATVERVMGLADRSEFKRRQMAPALRLMFGRRSFPLNHGFRKPL